MADEPRDPPDLEAGPHGPAGDIPPSPAEPEDAQPTAIVHKFPLLAGGKKLAGRPAGAAGNLTPGEPQATSVAPPPLQPLPTLPATLTVQARREQVYIAHVQGHSFLSLARHFGISVTSAARDYNRMRTSLTREDAASLRDLLHERMEEATRRLLDALRSAKGREVALLADALAKVNERQARLHGVDAPLKVASTTPDGTRWAPLAVERLVAAFTLPELRVLERAAKLRLMPEAVDGEVVSKHGA